MTPRLRSLCHAQRSAAAAAERGAADGGGSAAADRHYLNVAAECAIVGGSARSTLNFLAALDMTPQRSLSTALRASNGGSPPASPSQQADGFMDLDAGSPAASAAVHGEDADGNHEMPRRAAGGLHVTLPDEAQSPVSVPPAFDMATLLLGSGHSSVFELGLGHEPSPQTVTAH